MKIKNQLATFAIKVQGYPVRLKETELGIYVCITDIARSSQNDLTYRIVSNYLRKQINVEFLALWELHYNPDFNTEGFRNFKEFIHQPRTFSLSHSKWINETNAIGLIYVPGRFGGTYVHRDIAMHMLVVFNAEIYLFLTKELQRLKEAEQNLFNNPEKIPLEEIIAEANRMREEERDTSEKIRKEEE